MAASAFDALRYFENLKKAGVPDEQAKVQANAMRDFTEIQQEAIRENLAAKGELRETELRLQKEIKDSGLRLQKEIREVALRMLKWQWGIAMALAAIMAKGFNWLGF